MAVSALGRLLHRAQNAARLAVGNVGQRVAAAARVPGSQQDVGQQRQRAGHGLLVRPVADVAQQRLGEALFQVQAVERGRPFDGPPQLGAAHRRQVDLGRGHRLAQPIEVFQTVVEIGPEGDQDGGVAAARGGQQRRGEGRPRRFVKG